MTQIARMFTGLRPLAVLVAASTLIAVPVSAEVNLRVESRPNTDAIEAFVRVTDGSGPVTGLIAADFAVTLDGGALNTFTLSLPPDQDPTQKVSVVLVVTEPLFEGTPIVGALADFINQMAVGDYAAIVKFRAPIGELGSRPPPARPEALPFTLIDRGAGTESLIAFLSVPTTSPVRYWSRTEFDGMNLAVDQFAAPPAALPIGPKAIILIGNGGDRSSAKSQSDVVAYANENGIAVFTVGVGDIVDNPGANALMASLADDTGGTYLVAAEDAQVKNTLRSVAGLLTSAYRLTIPQSAVTDCFPHVLEVTSQGQSENIAFTRCDTTPDDFQIFGVGDVAPGTVTVSHAVSITGIESPASIRVIDGEYSIGCGSTFTATAGFILPDQKVCVRHTTSIEFASSTSTLLIVGGVSSWFESTTRPAPAAPPPPVSPPPQPVDAGGGGASGMVELLFALGALLARRRRIVPAAWASLTGDRT